MKFTFHNENSHIAIAQPLSKDCVLDCHTTPARDAWLGALFTARGRLDVDTESELVLSGDDDSDDDVDAITITGDPNSSASRRNAKRDTLQQADDAENDGESDTNEYSDALLAFQDVRSSMMQCHLAMSLTKEDLFVAPDASLQSKHHHIHATRSEEAARLKCLRSVLVFIESVAHGGRVVLLHLGVLASAGITVEDLLLALGEKQKENPRRGSLTSSTISLTKLYVATFVRDMLFHPVYSKRIEVQSEHVNVLIDRFFSHCRLRRFSHDDDQMALMSVHPVGVDFAATKALMMLRGAQGDGTSALDRPPPPSTATMSKAEMLLKKKRHSFPNILTPLRAKAGLLDATKLEELLRKGTKGPAPSDAASQGGGAAVQSIGPENRKTDNSTSTSSSSSFGTLDSGIFRDDSAPEPLGSLLWRNSCQEIAEQISLFHHKQIARLSLWDFLHNPREAAKDLTESFNRLATYFVWSVLLEDTAKDRAETIENIISIALAAASVSLNNFHLVMACVGCLGDTPLMVSRLPATWKKVRAKFKTHLRELRTLCDHAGGFDNLRKRQTITSAKGCCIPFVGVIGVALERLRATTYFSGDRSAMLDFEKLERQYSALHVLENAIQRPYKHLLAVEQLHAFLENLTLGFATPRLLQLRSQQILVSESAGSSGGSSRHTSFLQPVAGESSDSGPVAAVSAAPSFLTFRNVCSTLIAVPTASERVQICLETLFADEKQPLASQLRKFWLDFKTNVWVTPCHFVVQSVRVCIDTLQRDVVATKASELQQISGLDEASTELRQLVYEKLVRLVTQPIFTWVMTKVKRAFATEDVKMQMVILAASSDEFATGGDDDFSGKNRQSLDHQPLSFRERSYPLLSSSYSQPSSPMELVAWISWLCSEETDNADSLAHSDADTSQRLLHRLSAIDDPHLFSKLYVVQQVLGYDLLPVQLRDGVVAMERVLELVQTAS